MLRKKKFRTKAMRKAQAKSRSEAERARWERLARKAATSDNDNRTLQSLLGHSL